MEAAIVINFNPTRTLGIRGIGRYKYWMIGVVKI
jgi:hypothetical protein